MLPQNVGICFKGIEKGGPFELTPADAERMLRSTNPNGKPSSDVLKRYVIGNDLNDEPQERWLIDFGSMPESDAQLYALPYQYCYDYVRPVRATNREKRLREQWWQRRRSGDGVKNAIARLAQYICTSQVSKHRFFQHMDSDTAPDGTVIVFCREDDYFLDILESRIHKAWTAAIGTQLREKESGQRYIIRDCFEKFPFPTPRKCQREAVARAARTLETKRRNVCQPNGRYSQSMTSLHDENPAWLQTSRCDLDRAVMDAYGWSTHLTDEDILENLVRLNLSGKAGSP